MLDATNSPPKTPGRKWYHQLNTDHSDRFVGPLPELRVSAHL